MCPSCDGECTHMCARYLSPDADEVLESVDLSTIYVVGTSPTSWHSLDHLPHYHAMSHYHTLK